MYSGQYKRAVGVFSSRKDAEYALNELSRSGFPMNTVSIIARDSKRQDDIAGVDVGDRVGNKTDEGAGAGALTGGTLGGITGLLVGLGALAIPGVGPVVLAGEIATTLATTIAGGAIGAATGGLIGALMGLGIPEERARKYNDRVTGGGYLIIIDGTDDQIALAETVLSGRGIKDWAIYDAPGVNARDNYTDMNPMSGTTGLLPIADPLLGVPAPTSYDPMPMSGGTGIVGAPMGVTPVGINYATTSIGGTPSGVGAQKRAIGVFSSRNEVEYALNELRDAGFDMDRVSVVAQDANRDDEIAGVNMSDKVGNKADDGAKTGAVTGGALGGLTGLLVGLGAVAIPGIGPVMLAGAAATAIATTLSGGAIGAAAGGLVGALVGLGIPEEQARAYNSRLGSGDYLVIVDGTDSEIGRAGAILSNRGVQDWGIYDAPGDTATTNTSTVETTRTDYPPSVSNTEPRVTIIDRRDETV